MSTVTCADCASTVPADQVDLSVNGWRCRTCSLRHQIDVHRGADEQIGELSVHEMDQRANRAMGIVVLSILVAVASVALLAAGAFDGEGRRARRIFGLVIMSIPTSIGVACYELIAWRRARRAVEVMRSRDAAGLDIVQ